MIGGSVPAGPLVRIGLAAGWAAVVVWGAARRRPLRGRLADLAQPMATRVTARGRDRGASHAAGDEERAALERAVIIRLAAAARIPVELIGRGVRRAAGLASDATADGRLGLALIAAVAAAFVSVPMSIPVALGVWGLPWLVRRRTGRRHSDRVLDELPDAVDLLRLTLGSGTSLRLAIAAVAPRCGPTIGAGFYQVGHRLQRGAVMADALADLRSLGDPFGPVLDALLLSERCGAPITPLLDRIADDARRARRRRAEEVARRVPVTLLFPLVFCTLPAFGLLTVVPLLASAMGRLSF